MIKFLIIIFLVSCGSDTEYVSTVKKVVEEKVTIEYIPQDFENVYYFENGGFLELVVSEDNQISILRNGYSLTSVNPENGTLAQHPVVVRENLEPKDNKITFSQNVNYGSSSQFDLEEDISGNNITGNKRTDFTFELVDDQLTLTIKIYENEIGKNINSVIATRIFKSI